MPALHAFAIAVGGILALKPAAADTARKYQRSGERQHYSYGYAPSPYSRFTREQVECERARHEDPSGVYAGYPCWAREALGAGSNRSRR
jgi:hypothetical protein